jgi:hypothetical protein
MEKPVSELMAAISPEEWAQVPASVLELIQELVRRMDKLEKEVLELRVENELLKEQLAKNSANSSLPPSKNPSQTEIPEYYVPEGLEKKPLSIIETQIHFH